MAAQHERGARNDLARRTGNVLSSAPTWAGTTSILIGDHIENQGNADWLQATAAMFGWEFGLLTAPDSAAALARIGVPIVAIENASGAEDLFRFRPPDGPVAVVVGNERKGISRSLLRRADHVVQIPIASTTVNTLNVAAAAAVALYCQSR
ncbi:MAG TPA: TrmH family RNA methyltransferase, partial [Kofleriaceae bacterium]|nr:TrmH family RNA methyltransferase [Kofleriaceae bacterium]